MRRVACAAVVVTGLVLGDGLMDLLEARVGGGGSSGSRGSRSYSAPLAPSPAAPSTPRPAPPVAGPSMPSSPARPGGLFGGWGGMLGGLVMGGLIGSLLFGHGGGYGGGMGFGLLELLLVAGLGVLLVSFLRRRAAQPASPAGYAPASWAPPADVTSAPAPASTTNGPVAAGAVVAAADDLARGVAAIRTMDPSFDPGHFVPIATDLFTRLQIGWSGEDLAAVRAHLTDEMAVALEKDLARFHEKGRRNRVEDVRVESAEVTEAWQEYGRDLVTVRFRARAVDYTVDVATGEVVEGSRAVPVPFDEFWTFSRPVGQNAWRLGAIQQPSAA